MLEESRMDKKSLNRSSQPQSRASAIDCKKSTELTNKPWPRNNKKREGSSSAPKNEQFRRNVPAQRGRGQMDRRSHARGPSNFAVGGAPSTGIEEDDEPEMDSVLLPGKKKQNLNHLLNFMYPSRRGAESRGAQPRRQGLQHVFHRHDHDLYLRAYCQFVVKEDGDYRANLLDPDAPFKWDQIEEIVVRSTGRSECPICLGPPVAGRVGHCGHVYCWACVLHYAAAHEKQPPPCPVCTTPLNVKEMKSTRMVQWESPADEVTMRLVRRLRGTTTVEIAPPRGQLVDTKPTPILPLTSINDSPYCKLFAANKQQVHEIMERERREIKTQILEEIDTSETIYLEEALQMLQLKENNIKMQSEPTKKLVEISKETAPIVYEKQVVNEKHIDWFDVTDDDDGLISGASCLDSVTEQIDHLDLATVDSSLNPDAPEFTCDDFQPEEFPLTECSLSPSVTEETENEVCDIDKHNQAKYFYFYQAEDGQQVFLNSLNVRMLNASWGALAAAPPIIHGRVLHRETLPLSEQTRKHMPYTAHLPLYCSFDIVELDLQPPHVTLAALQSFTEDLDRRARLRARHERDERRRERAYRRAMEGPPKPDFSSDLMFPPALPSYFSPPLYSGSLPSLEATSSFTSTRSTSTSNASPSAGPSFAKMASAGGVWRVRQTQAPPPPPTAEDEDAGAPRALYLSDAIEAALQAAPSPAPKSSKKNKKSKQKVLFVSGMQRAD